FVSFLFPRDADDAAIGVASGRQQIAFGVMVTPAQATADRSGPRIAIHEKKLHAQVGVCNLFVLLEESLEQLLGHPWGGA
ncbi:MAG TPA: hypothetical protein VJM78_08525, partial [Rhizomicrobium sp.]|nr:hypothetical protein [Rhizomicrobium sp.]